MKGSAGLMAAGLVAATLLFAGGADAQTKKRPVRKTATTTRPQTTPVVVGRSDEYTQTSQQIITGGVQDQQFPVQPQPTEQPQPAETLDQKIDRLNSRLKEMNSRMKAMETTKQTAADERRRRLMLNIDILTRAEQRAEALRKQQYDLVEKENSIKQQLTGLEYDTRPDVIERQIGMAGSLRPEELREQRRKSLELQRTNLQDLLTDIQARRADLQENVRKADELVNKLRQVLEKDIDDTLAGDSEEK